MTPKQLQQALKGGSFYDGEIDGLWGPRTLAAARAWFTSGGAIGKEPAATPVVESAVDAPVLLPTEARLPADWLPRCEVMGIVTHWTAGSYEVSDIDREHYHFIIGGDGRVVRGENSIADNVSTGDGDYAAHTRGANTKRIGIAVACMAGAVERPFDGGRYPMTELQWKVMALVAAECVKAYKLTVSRTTVLGHGEVQSVLSIPQRGKWDPMVLPWAPAVPSAQVGEMFRTSVRKVLETL